MFALDLLGVEPLQRALHCCPHAGEERNLVALTIGSDPCFGGDLDTVNVYSALLVARATGAGCKNAPPPPEVTCIVSPSASRR